MTTPKNPQGQYQAPPGYRAQPNAAPWAGAYKGSQPRIKGVSALQAAAIKNDWRNKSSLTPGPSSQELAEQAQDQEAARQLKRSTNFEKGYEGYRKSMGFGPQQTPPPAQTPEQHQRQQMILGGLQPHEADLAVAQTKSAAAPAPGAATPPPAPSATNPTPAIPAPAPAPAPVVAPAVAPTGSTVTDNGKTSSLADWITGNKVRQSDPNRIGPNAADAAALPQTPAPPLVPTPAPMQAAKVAMSPQQTSVQRNEAAHTQQVQDQIYPERSAAHVAQAQGNAARVAKANQDDITALGQSMRPDTMPQASGNADDIEEPKPRASGGPVTGVISSVPPTWVGRAPTPAAPAVAPGVYAAARPIALKKGGPAKKEQTYKVGEKGPELFMPKDKNGQPIVVGKDGPEVGTFPTDGTIIPNHALSAMRGKFANQKTDDDDQAGASPLASAKKTMRPQAAA